MEDQGQERDTKVMVVHTRECQVSSMSNILKGEGQGIEKIYRHIIYLL
jgi:hypothetical protein